MSDTTTTPVIMLATTEFKDDQILLTMHDKSKTKVEFILDPMAVAVLALTIAPAMRAQLAAEKAKHPEKFPEGGFPDTPEGL